MRAVADHSYITQMSRAAAEASFERKEQTNAEDVDVVLSSGFLAFSRHTGFLRALEHDERFCIASMMATSSGAIVGSLLAAGYTTEQISHEIKRLRPVQYFTPSTEPWRGCFRLERLVQRMRNLLPERFEDLQIPFTCGAVAKRTGEHVCIRSGPLPEAVVSSAAVPVLFEPVAVPGRGFDSLLFDGGAIDRVGLRPYRQNLYNETAVASNERVYRRAICHVIERSSSTFGGDDDVEKLMDEFDSDDVFVHSPRANESILGLKAFDEQMLESEEITKCMLAGEDASNVPRKRKTKASLLNLVSSNVFNPAILTTQRSSVKNR